MPTPYDPPESELESEVAPRAHPSIVSRTLAIISSVSSALIFVGIGATIFKMCQHYVAIQMLGTGDPKFMAEGISQALVPFFVFGFYSSFGLVISIVTVAFTAFRKRWLFIVLIVNAVANFLYIPLGTTLGAALLILLFVKRHEFRKVV